MENEKRIETMGNCDHPERKGPYYLKVLDAQKESSMTPWPIEVCELCGVLIAVSDG